MQRGQHPRLNCRAPSCGSGFRVLSLLVLDPGGQRAASWGKSFARAGLSLASHATVEALLAAHARAPADAILAQVTLESPDPVALSAELRRGLGATPLVLMLEASGESLRYAAIGAGADEVLPASAPPSLVLAAIQARIRRLRLTAPAPAIDDSVPQRSGALPRAAFLEQLMLAQQIDEAGACRGLLSLRLDEAETLAEQLGFAAKLELERQMRERIQPLLSAADAFCLWLDFAYGILARRARPEDLRTLGEDLCRSMAAAPFEVCGEHRALTASVGLALPPGDHGRGDPDAWFASAHAAQSIARRLGGNRVDGILASDAPDLPPERLLIIRERVKEAAQGRNIEIEFQPIVPLDGCGEPMYALHTRLRDFRAPMHGVERREYLQAARDASAMALIDRISLFRALEVLETCPDGPRLLVPLDMVSIDRTQQAWLSAELKRRRPLATALALEFDLGELRNRRGAEKALAALRAMDVAISLDTGRQPLINPGELLTLPADLLRVSVDRITGLSPQRFAGVFRPWLEAGRRLLVDGVDDRKQLLLLCALGVPLALGAAIAAAGPRMDYDFNLDLG
jgi:predicted signal transduction protein with EAL and GGDEF domain